MKTRSLVITVLSALTLLCLYASPCARAQSGRYGRPTAPIGLSAAVAASGPGVCVNLHWNAVAGSMFYLVLRNNIDCGLTMSTSLTDNSVVQGQSYSYSVCAIAYPIAVGPFCTPISVAASLPPAAPTGLTASGVWVTDCPVCHMAMAHIVLAWNAVSGATSYAIYRGGTPLATVTTPGYTDMDIVSGTSYTYTVAAVGAVGTGPQSATASAIAPEPPTPTATLNTAFTAPSDLRIKGYFDSGPGDILSWDPVPGADSYNVYQYNNLIVKGVTGTTYTISLSQFNPSMTYTVTAYNSAMGMESIPSAIVSALGAPDPANVPSWAIYNPVVPYNVAAVGDWNGGLPRIQLSWSGDQGTSYYNIYRNNIEVASGLWGLKWIDNNVQAGVTYSYSVSAVNAFCNPIVESPQTPPISGTALTGPPTASLVPVQILSVLPDDDSALVSFAPVPGAVDYRCYDVTNPGMVKYSGGGLSIEWNGINPSTGADLVVQAVDKLGPFQTSDGMMGPGSMTMSGGMNVAINGQGDPSNLPNVVASSTQFHVNCQSQALTGSQAFYDDFINEPALTTDTLSPTLAAISSVWYAITQQENSNWCIRTYGADTQMSSVFFMNNHFMDTLYDGPTAATQPFSHNNNASMTMMPKATADISGGKVLHVTFEVDGHFDGRRWCDVFVTAAGQPLTCSTPTKLNPGQALTPDGTDFVWQILQQTHDVELIHPETPGSNYSVMTDFFDLVSGVGTDDFGPGVRTTWDDIPLLNGTVQDLDKRHKFDLYLSQNHYRVVETILGQAPVVVKDEDFPDGLSLPFTDCQVYFVHELYHTANDRHEQIDENPATNAYWYNNRPWSDERHWDDMGFEVLPSFPPLPGL